MGVITNEPIFLRHHIQATYELLYDHLGKVTHASLRVQSNFLFELQQSKSAGYLSVLSQQKYYGASSSAEFRGNLQKRVHCAGIDSYMLFTFHGVDRVKDLKHFSIKVSFHSRIFEREFLGLMCLIRLNCLNVC